MKLTKVEPFSKAAPGFNHAAANEVYDAIMACPDDDSAAVMTRAIVFDVLNRDIARHHEFIAKAYNEQVQKKAADIKGAILRQYIAKSAQGEDTSELVRASKYLSVISKDIYDYSRSERSRNAQMQRRGSSGQFVREHNNIKYTHAQPVDKGIFDRLYGVTSPERHDDGTRLSAVQRRNWQEAYQQANDLIGPYQNHPGAKVHLRYPQYEKIVAPKDLHTAITTKQRPLSAAVSVDDYYDTSGPDFYNMFNAVGAPDMGARVQGTIATPAQWDKSGLNPARLATYRTTNEAPLGGESGYAQPGARLFRRLTTGSSLLSDTLGDQAPQKVKAALAAGQWVGDYGPEAQRVIGPTAQKTSYRYRGVEKRPDGAVLAAFNATSAKLNDKVLHRSKPYQVKGRSAGLQPDQQLTRTFNQIATRMPNSTPSERLQYAIHGASNEKGIEQASPLIQYFKNRLPQANLNNLQTMSGTVPPSEGILLDKNGKLVTQAVGYGDDWYLPFNLKNVNRMRGGTYIRTRTFGGPTTEDVYTALISGADSLTVVSHNGVYTMQFDKSFKGGRRYNDKAARMVARYGQLLDAVKSQKVTLDLMDPARTHEIREEASRNVRDPDDSVAVQAEVDRMIRAERVNPKLSAPRTAEIKNAVLTAEAEKMKTASGAPAGIEGLRAKAVLDQIRGAGMNPHDPAMAEGARKLYDNLESDDALITALGLQDDVTTAEVAEKRKIKRELSPLSLNGQGYNLALQSLQEQFPYYINKPIYHEWTDAADKRDSGYIKPRHVRPEGALIGYFDGTIDGGVHGSSGKITADTQYSLTPHAPSIKDPLRAPAQATTGTAGATGSAGSTGAERAANVTPAFVKAQADRELANHILALANEKRGNDANAWMFDLTAQNPAQKQLAVLFNMTPGEIDEKIDKSPDAFNQQLAFATREITSKKLFDIDPKLVENSRRRGAMPEARKFDYDDPSAALNAPDDEFDLKSAVFSPGHHTKKQILDKYNEDNDIRAAGLPGLEDAGFSAAYGAAIQNLRGEVSKVPLLRSRAQFTPRQENDLNSKIRGTIKAKHLHRRLSEVPPEITAAPETPDRTMVVTPESLRQMMGMAAPEGTAAIEGQNTPTAEEFLRMSDEERKKYTT